MNGNCPRCQGALNQQWDVTLRQWEDHCLTCGYLRPVVRVMQSPYTRGLGDTELPYCAGCREEVNRQARIRWKKQDEAGKLTKWRKVG